MSKPETPNGAQIVDLMGALRASLGVRQDAPKAETPPAPVSEPPKCVPLEWGVMDAASAMGLIAEARAERDALKAQNATLTAEVKRLRETNTSLNRRATKAEGVVLSKARHESAAGRSLGRALANASWVAISAENDGLRETLQDIAKLADFQIPPYAYGDNEAACDMAHRLEQIFRAAREAGKA